MFTGFKINLNENEFNGNDLYNIGYNICEGYKRELRSSLDTFMVQSETISASQLEKEWFPSVDVNIFLSHSHKDEKIAVLFAGWLSKTFGVKTFVDSCVWGYSDELLTQINNKYSILRKESDGSTTYHYSKCNRAAGHVHMILQGALAKMINNAECLIFLNTPNSISTKQSIDKTFSPWIYNELLLSSMIEHKKWADYRKKIVGNTELFHMFEQRELSIEYDAFTKHLIELKPDELYEWEKKNNGNKVSWKSMDNLYIIKGILPNYILG